MNTTNIVISVSVIVILVLLYLAYRWYENRIQMDLCAAQIINKIKSWSSSREDWNAFCVWLDSIDESCVNSSTQFGITINTPGNKPRTIVYTNTDGILSPQYGKVFPSCGEDYPVRGMTMVFNVNGNTLTKVWPGPLKK